LRLAVVADPIGAEIDAGKPEDAGLFQLRERLADSLPGDGDIEVAGAGQATLRCGRVGVTLATAVTPA
jgi:hypothetical protein